MAAETAWLRLGFPSPGSMLDFVPGGMAFAELAEDCISSIIKLSEEFLPCQEGQQSSCQLKAADEEAQQKETCQTYEMPPALAALGLANLPSHFLPQAVAGSHVAPLLMDSFSVTLESTAVGLSMLLYAGLVLQEKEMRQSQSKEMTREAGRVMLITGCFHIVSGAWPSWSLPYLPVRYLVEAFAVSLWLRSHSTDAPGPENQTMVRYGAVCGTLCQFASSMAGFDSPVAVWLAVSGMLLLGSTALYTHIYGRSGKPQIDRNKVFTRELSSDLLVSYLLVSPALLLVILESDSPDAIIMQCHFMDLAKFLSCSLLVRTVRSEGCLYTHERHLIESLRRRIADRLEGN
eukprot:TRINITY_DN91021_c0_g1_i1.p1 TRINITY_DN91021_c0_g1~~TRINITY_DN91021_c0_g1_i1.p1  ORF type:complete len:347 (-),score=64.42 TRINITY_DN91021_c0_g1_i1:84-1124(-)